MPFPLFLFTAVVICAEKSAFQESAMCMTLLFKKYTELFGLCNIKRLEHPTNCKFLRVRNYVLYSTGNFMLPYSGLQTEPLLSSNSGRSQI